MSVVVASCAAVLAATVIEELGKGFNGVGPSLQALIDNGNALTEEAIANLPAQLKLIDDPAQPKGKEPVEK